VLLAQLSGEALVIGFPYELLVVTVPQLEFVHVHRLAPSLILPRYALSKAGVLGERIGRRITLCLALWSYSPYVVEVDFCELRL
jgi:hypothetical protein